MAKAGSSKREKLRELKKSIKHNPMVRESLAKKAVDLTQYMKDHIKAKTNWVGVPENFKSYSS